MKKLTKADLERRIRELEAEAMQRDERDDLIKRVCLARALRNDVRGGAHVHAANTYRLFIKMMEDPAEIHRMIRETVEWVERGLPRNGR